MENEKGGFKVFLITLAVILFSVVGFIIKIFINSTPIEDFPSFTPIIFVVIIVASVGYSLYAIFFGNDSFYRKKRLENRAKREEELKKTYKEKTLREIFEEKKNVTSKKRGANWILIALITTVLLSLIGGAFYWFEYRPTQIKKDCSWTEYKTGKWREAKESEYEKCLRRNGLLE